MLFIVHSYDSVFGEILMCILRELFRLLEKLPLCNTKRCRYLDVGRLEEIACYACKCITDTWTMVIMDMYWAMPVMSLVAIGMNWLMNWNFEPGWFVVCKAPVHATPTWQLPMILHVLHGGLWRGLIAPSPSTAAAGLGSEGEAFKCFLLTPPVIPQWWQNACPSLSKALHKGCLPPLGC